MKHKLLLQDVKTYIDNGYNDLQIINQRSLQLYSIKQIMKAITEVKKQKLTYYELHPYWS